MSASIYHTNGDCPICRSSRVEGDYFEIAEDERGEYAFQRCTCEACGCKFVNVYRYEQTEVYE